MTKDQKNQRKSFNDILEGWSLIDSVSRSAELSDEDAQQLSDFLGILLSDVVCRQVLTEAVSDLKSAFGLNFTFEPKIQLKSLMSVENSMARCGIVVTATADQLLGWQDVARVFGESFSQTELDFLSGDVQKEAFLKCSLLKSLFSNECNIYSPDNTLHVFLSPRQSQSLHALLSEPEFSVTLDLKKHESIESLLAGLLADGYDLTSLKPFLEA